MKEAELRKHATCDCCHQKIGHTGQPLFWRVTVERFGIDMQAARRQTGLGMMIGSALAQVMGRDEDIAKPLIEPTAITVCEHCMTRDMLALLAAASPMWENAETPT